MKKSMVIEMTRPAWVLMDEIIRYHLICSGVVSHSEGLRICEEIWNTVRDCKELHALLHENNVEDDW